MIEDNINAMILQIPWLLQSHFPRPWNKSLGSLCLYYLIAFYTIPYYVKYTTIYNTIVFCNIPQKHVPYSAWGPPFLWGPKQRQPEPCGSRDTLQALKLETATSTRRPEKNNKDWVGFEGSIEINFYGLYKRYISCIYH